MFSPADSEHQFNGPISPVALATAHLDFIRIIAFIRTRSEVAFFRSMVLGQLKTIRMRRADGTIYSALMTDLQFYHQQFRNSNRLAAEMCRAIDGRDIPLSPAAGQICDPDPHPPKTDIDQ
jgi:hypothetical protein